MKQEIAQNKTNIETEKVNTLHMLKGGVVSVASGNVTLNNGLQNIDQEIDKIRATTIGAQVCTPMTDQALLADLQSTSCSSIILYKQHYTIPIYYLSIANKHIYAATRMPVSIAMQNVGHIDFAGQVILQGVHLTLRYFVVHGDLTLQDDQITINNSVVNLWYQKFPGGITVSSNAQLKMIIPC